MRSIGFRVKLVVIIVVTVCLVSFASFKIFTHFLDERILKTSETTLNHVYLPRGSYSFCPGSHPGLPIDSLMKPIERNWSTLRAYFADQNSKVIYPKDYSSLKGDTALLEKLFAQRRDITLKAYGRGHQSFQRAFIRLRNSPECFSCHSSDQKYLGIIIMDVRNRETHEMGEFTRIFGFSFTMVLLLCVFSLVGYLHYKFIRKSLYQFRSTISQVNEGNLQVRLQIPAVQELGSLGSDFNLMLDKLERTQKELRLYHQKELQNSQNLATIGEMSARIAHEIRNPITGIARAMEIIIAEMKDSDNKPILEEIQRQATRVNLAISNLLRFSRSNTVCLGQGDINVVVQTLVFLLKNQAQEKEITYEVTLGNNIPIILFDLEQIENVLLNLSYNAIQAIPNKGIIRFNTSFDPLSDRVLISVCDNGPGITPETGAKIFIPFYTTRTKGSGLGLAISKDIIEKHNGALWYENNPEGGCTFYVSLPKHGLYFNTENK